MVQAHFAAGFEALDVWQQMMIEACPMRVADLLNAKVDAAPILDSQPVLADPPRLIPAEPDQAGRFP
ncbi:hypothetical protein [Phaeovulum sp. NW3]|uniref:hypothetical protein n=1 Tax=Phaeovulum sp. NW3 TaxID=2934933 RepID=UPI0020211227|nr:hypothetical protein [Phaeovulum sp. NW3]MCL7466569.1 hypothetical protein [Phaeovulum sp. NW3]